MKHRNSRLQTGLACSLAVVLLGGCSWGEVEQKVSNVSNAVSKEVKVVKGKVDKEVTVVKGNVDKEIKGVKRDVDKLIPHPDKDLAVAGYRLETYQGGKKLVVGTLQNKSNRQYSKVAVSFNLYDSSGALIGNTKADVTNLDPHGTWKFDAPVAVKREQVAQVKLKEISGS